MEDKLKYRLVGATVILALMAFFLPLILDSKKYKTEIVSQIPPMPEAVNQGSTNPQINRGTSFNSESNQAQEEGALVIDLSKGLDEQTKVDPAEKPVDEASEKVEEAAKETVTEPVTEVKPEPVKPKPKPVSVVEKKPETVKPQSKPVEEKPKEATPVVSKPKPVETVKEELATPDFKESAYVIQIGSFSNKENATNLVQQLRDQEYRAYQRVSNDLSRVFVGPYPEESIAKSRSEALAKIVGNSVKVIKFDPIKH